MDDALSRSAQARSIKYKKLIVLSVEFMKSMSNCHIHM